jgi:hypothetical protein
MMKKDQDFAAMISAASVILARNLTQVETNKDRKIKMGRVLAKKWDAFRDTFPQIAIDIPYVSELDTFIRRCLPMNMAITLLVDLSFSDPFSPYQLKFEKKDFHIALVGVANLLGISAERVKQLEQTQKDAMRAHRHVAWGKIVLWGTGGMIFMAVGGWIAAPWIASSIGTAAGLAGAAATAHGLAILGGGSLALGGFGMAGGMWIVAGTAATFGATVLGGGTLLLQLGAAQVKIELLKLQVSYREVLLLTQTELGKAKKVIANLESQRAEIDLKLKEECALNDDNAHRIRELESILLAVDDSLKWIKEQKAA